MPLLVLQWMGVVLAGLLGLKYSSRLFGIDLFGPVNVPVATTPSNPSNPVVTPPIVQPPQPTTAAIVKDLSSNPLSLLAVAAIVFGIAIVLKNIRGAAIEAGSGIRSTYKEARDNVDSASDPKAGKRK
jgi:hypothetical protein